MLKIYFNDAQNTYLSDDCFAMCAKRTIPRARYWTTGTYVAQLYIVHRSKSNDNDSDAGKIGGWLKLVGGGWLVVKLE